MMPPKGSVRIPPPLRLWLILPALLVGVLGTGLLYRAATLGSFPDLIVGGVLFAFGLRVAGRPFVLASALHRKRRPGARNDSPTP